MTLDSGGPGTDPADMSGSPYAQPFDDFVARTRTAAADQVEQQPLPEETTGLDWSAGPDGD